MYPKRPPSMRGFRWVFLFTESLDRERLKSFARQIRAPPGTERAWAMLSGSSRVSTNVIAFRLRCGGAAEFDLGVKAIADPAVQNY